MFQIEPAEKPDRPYRSCVDYNIERITDTLSVFIPADHKGTPKQTRASIHARARYLGIKVEIFSDVKEGVPGFRVFRRADDTVFRAPKPAEAAE